MNKILILTKNYLKLIFRNKVMVLLVAIGTILVIAAVSNAFHSLLDNASADEGFTVGYQMTEGSRYGVIEDMLAEGLAEEDITLVRYRDADPEELIRKGEVAVFVVFGQDDYSLIGNNGSQIDARIIQYSIYKAERAMNGSLASVTLDSSPIPYRKVSGAENYYGLIECAYFSNCCSIFLCLIYYTERKGNIGMRFKSALSGGTAQYLAKLAACVFTSFIVQLVAVPFFTVLLFDVHIGRPVITLLLMILSVIAYTSFGMLFFIIFRNSAASISLLFMLLWFAGYIGGSFETYMYSSVPESLKRLSPAYYVNRTLVELSVEGRSDFLIPAVRVLLLMTAVSIPLGILLTAKKKEV